MNNSEIKNLQYAKKLLEHPGLAIKITNYVGMPIEKGMELLPKGWNLKIGEIAQKALLKASEAAIFTIKDIPGKQPSNLWHKLSVGFTGGVGGFFGLPALALELPISTTIMLRSIAEIAQSEGESLNSFQTKLACLEVFALGGKNIADDSSESGYFVVRSMLAKSVSDASEYLLRRAITEEGSPLLIKFITNISQRFGIHITEKAAAQSLPIIGAIGGAVINTIFIDHFQDMAKGHFIVRRLERTYGKENIQLVYNSLPSS